MLSLHKKNYSHPKKKGSNVSLYSRLKENYQKSFLKIHSIGVFGNI